MLLTANQDAMVSAIQNNSQKIQAVSQEVASIWNIIYPIGSYYETSDSKFNPNTAWGGVWERMTGGEVLIDSGYSSENAAGTASSTVDVNQVVGNKWHTLTIEEMPSHTHDVRATNGWGSLDFGFDFTYTNTASWNGSGTNEVGGDLRFELTPKARVVVRWHRTA